MMTQYLFLRLGSILAGYVPVRLGYFLATAFARMAYARGGRRRRTLFHNLTQVVGGSADEQDVAEIALESYRNLARYYYEFMRLPHMSRRELAQRVRFHGLEHLDRVVRAGKGVILVSGHLGNWDVVGAALSALYHTSIYSVAERLRPQKLHDLFVATRAAVGIDVISVSTVAAVMLRVLRQGGIVGLICDRDLQGNGVQVSFFGALTTMPRGPVALALKTGASIVPVFSRRQPDNSLVAEIGTPIALQVTGDTDRDVALNTQKIADCLEAAIGKDPSQWFVMQPIWPNSNPEVLAGNRENGGGLE